MFPNSKTQWWVGGNAMWDPENNCHVLFTLGVQRPLNEYPFGSSTIVLVGIYNQQFQGTIFLMVDLTSRVQTFTTWTFQQKGAVYMVKRYLTGVNFTTPYGLIGTPTGRCWYVHFQCNFRDFERVAGLPHFVRKTSSTFLRFLLSLLLSRTSRTIADGENGATTTNCSCQW